MSEDLDLRKLVADVAAAYFRNSHVTPTEIPTVIDQIANSLSAIGAPVAEAPAEPEAQPKLTPAQIRKSITRDALISFEDSKPYKTLRRHLAVRGLSPDEYKNKWGLPKDYPMVAPSYSETRASLARSFGLGNRASRSEAEQAPPTPAAEAAPAPEAKPAPKARRRAPTQARKPKTTGANTPA